MLGKLGEFLNKDMGTLVKDAGKVLNTDVGALAKGAGKVLSSDVGDLLRDKKARPTAGEAVALPEPSAAHAELVPKIPAMPPERSITRTPPPSRATSAPPVASSPAATIPANAEAATAAPFNADATLKLAPGGGHEATTVMAPGGGTAATALPQLADDLVARHTRKMPAGTSLLELLPHVAGEFERPKSTPVGELTSDPVTAMYGVTGHPVAIKLVQCWDEEEAREHLGDVKKQAGNNFRMGEDKSWILGETLQGLMFAWTRGNYSFTATAPKGEISMMRFLKAFPY